MKKKNILTDISLKDAQKLLDDGVPLQFIPPHKKDPDLSHIRQTIDDLDYTINMMRGEIRAKEDAAASIGEKLKQDAYRKIPLSLFYGFLFGTGMYLAVFTLENLV